MLKTYLFIGFLIHIIPRQLRCSPHRWRTQGWSCRAPWLTTASWCWPRCCRNRELGSRTASPRWSIETEKNKNGLIWFKCGWLRLLQWKPRWKTSKTLWKYNKGLSAFISTIILGPMLQIMGGRMQRMYEGYLFYILHINCG